MRKTCTQVYVTKMDRDYLASSKANIHSTINKWFGKNNQNNSSRIFFT